MRRSGGIEKHYRTRFRHRRTVRNDSTGCITPPASPDLTIDPFPFHGWPIPNDRITSPSPLTPEGDAG